MTSKGLHNDFSHIFNIQILILLWPWALIELRFWIIFDMPVFISFTIGDRLSVREWSRGTNLLSLWIKEYCLAKKEIKSLAFTLKSNLLLWNNGGITVILRLFRKILNKAQYTLVLFWIVFTFCVNLRKYSCFESSARSRNCCCKELNFLRNWLLAIFLQ